MADNERLVKAAGPIVRAMHSPESVRRAQRVDRAIDNAGRVIQEPRPFVRLRSPDGSVWRLKVSDAGAITATKETA